MQETEGKTPGNGAADSRQVNDSARADREAAGSEAAKREAPENVQAVGNKTSESEAAENAKTEDVVVRDSAGRKKRLVIILGAAIILLAAVIIGISAFGGSGQKVQETVMTENEDGGRKLQEQLDLGMKYLEEMDYEQALAAFQAVLSIEPKNVDAYLGIVEVYIRTNEFDLALETAKEGYEVTGDERLKEKIDMIESGDIFASNGWTMKMLGYDGTGNLIYWHEYTYDLEGRQASVAKYNAQGGQEQYLELVYDEEGRRLVGYRYSSEGNLTKLVREYDGNNYRETQYAGTSDEISTYKDVEADADGKILKETTYGEDGSVLLIQANEYDGAGNLVKRMSYNAGGELKGYEIFTYDGEGRCLQLQSYGSDDRLEMYWEYIYDDEGNQIGEREYDANGVLQYESMNQ